MTDVHAASEPLPLKVARDTINKGDLVGFRAYIEAKPKRLRIVTPFGTWLHLAIMRGQPEIVRYLIDAGLDVNENSGVCDSNSLEVAASTGNLELLKYVHARGAVFDTSDSTRNPLFSAIVGGHKHIVRYLLDNGIDYTVKYTGEYMTNMDAVALAMERGELEIAKMIRNFAPSGGSG